MTTMTRQSSSARNVATVALLGAALALGACGEQGEPGDPLSPSGPTGRIRFVNAVSNATAAQRPVNVVLNGNLNQILAANLAFGAAAPVGAAVPYYPALAQAQALSVRRTADTATHVLDATVTVAAGSDYTLVAVRGGLDATGTPELVTLTDAGNTAPAAGKVKVRLAHMAPSAGGTLDVYFTPSTVTSIAAIAPQVTNLATRSATAYLDADAGTYTVRYTLAGTKTIVLTVATGALAGGAVRSVFALDAAAGGTPLTSLVLVDR